MKALIKRKQQMMQDNEMMAWIINDPTLRKAYDLLVKAKKKFEVTYVKNKKK